MSSYHGLRRCLTGLLFLLAADSSWAQGSLTTILSNGPTSNRLNLVVLSEGYTSNQLGQFLVDATNAVNALLTTPPYQSYRDYFNAFAISIISAQSGSDHYTPTTNLVNTYFNSCFDSYGIQRLVTIPPNDRDPVYAHGEGKVMALLQTLMPEYDLIILLVNDTQYGGSGGTFLISSLNSSSAEIVRHESGHTFGGLADEYSTPYPGILPAEMPNVTAQTNRSLIKWTVWISDNTPVPPPGTTQYRSAPGLFEGAMYQTNGWYRPKYDCKMNHLGIGFCEVCSEQLVKSLYRSINLIDSFSPPMSSFTVRGQETQLLSVVTLSPAVTNLTYQWFTNGIPVGGSNFTNYTLAAPSLPVGSNIVRVEVADPTAYVRNDPTLIMRDTNVWIVTVLSNDVPPTIVTQPSAAAVAAGDTFMFNVTASGTMPMAYQWRCNGTNLSDATGDSLTLTNVQASDAGSYTVLVTNVAGSVTSNPALLTVNTAPFQDAINNQTLHAGGSVTFTNIATDNDVPAQLITFSLDPGAPPNAVVGITNGVFTWQTTWADAGAIYPVTVRATDNGTPVMSSSRSFLITVVDQLTIISSILSNNVITLTWNAIPGNSYRLEYKNSFEDTAWTSVGTPILATGTSASYSDSIEVGWRWYRVRLE